jgi:hypothetical protein
MDRFSRMAADAGRKLNPGQFAGSRVGEHVARGLDLWEVHRALKHAALPAALRYGLGLPQAPASAGRTLRQLTSSGGTAPSSLNPGHYIAMRQRDDRDDGRGRRRLGSISRRQALLGMEDGDNNSD